MFIEGALQTDRKKAGSLRVSHLTLSSATLPNFDSSHLFFCFPLVLHVFTSNCIQADMPKAKTERSGFTVFRAKILLIPVELGTSHISLLDSKSVMGVCEEHACYAYGGNVGKNQTTNRVRRWSMSTKMNKDWPILLLLSSLLILQKSYS
jgi:hypothetical protein